MNNDISVRVYLWKLACSISELDEVPDVSREIPGFEFCQHIKASPDDCRDGDTETIILSYRYTDTDVFCNHITGSLLRIFSQRRDKRSPISPLFLSFDSRSFGPIPCEEVLAVRDHFLKKHNFHLQPVELFLMVEVRALKGTGIHDMVADSLVAGETGGPYRCVPDNWLFNRISSPSRVALSLLGEEVRTGLGVYVRTDFCIIELRFALTRLKDMPTTFEELAVHDWSHVYGQYFTLREPTDLLKKRI